MGRQGGEARGPRGGRCGEGRAGEPGEAGREARKRSLQGTQHLAARSRKATPDGSLLGHDRRCDY